MESNIAYSGLIHITYENEGIVHIKLNDQRGKNCLSPDMVHELTQHLQTIKSNDHLKVLILSGLPDVFCAGADMETLVKLGKGQIKPVDILLSKAILDIPFPVISAMEGHAIGGGLALGLCADIVIMAEESRYGCSFMNLGFTPGMGTTRLMEHFLSPAIAHELLYTGQNRKGADFKGIANFNHIVPKKEVESLASQLAMSIAEKPTLSLRVLKRYLSIERRKTFEETYSIETMMHELTFNQQDIHHLIKENYVR
jgi:polyketide biosynthesis enoyl-CoA hydratase PksI